MERAECRAYQLELADRQGKSPVPLNLERDKL